MTTTEQSRQQAMDALVPLLFIDKREEHPWNEFQMERQFGESCLCVWGRDHGGFILNWQQSDDYEDQVNLLETDDLPTMLRAVRLTIDFMEAMQALQAVPVA